MERADAPFPHNTGMGIFISGKNTMQNQITIPHSTKEADKGDETRRERRGNAKHQNKKQSKVTNYGIKIQLSIKAVKPSG